MSMFCPIWTMKSHNRLETTVSWAGSKMADNTSCYVNYYIKSECSVKPQTHDKWAASNKQKSQLTHKALWFLFTHKHFRTPRLLFSLFECAQITHREGRKCPAKSSRASQADLLRVCLIWLKSWASELQLSVHAYTVDADAVPYIPIHVRSLFLPLHISLKSLMRPHPLLLSLPLAHIFPPPFVPSRALLSAVLSSWDPLAGDTSHTRPRERQKWEYSCVVN